MLSLSISAIVETLYFCGQGMVRFWLKNYLIMMRKRLCFGISWAYSTLRQDKVKAQKFTLKTPGLGRIKASWKTS